MDDLQEWKNVVANFELGWTNQWAFMEQRDKLLEQKNLALKNKKLLKKEGYDVNDIYKQLETFKECVCRQIPITDNDNEKILLAIFEYAQNNRPIIISKMNDDLPKLYYAMGDTKSPKKAELRYKFDVYKSLVDFYLGYKEDFDLFEMITKFLEFGQQIKNSDPAHPENYYYTFEAIQYTSLACAPVKWTRKHIEKEILLLPATVNEKTEKSSIRKSPSRKRLTI